MSRPGYLRVETEAGPLQFPPCTWSKAAHEAAAEALARLSDCVVAHSRRLANARRLNGRRNA